MTSHILHRGQRLSFLALKWIFTLSRQGAIDGRIIAVGSSGWNTLLIARYDANGQPDTTFGTDGFTEVSGPDNNAFAVCRDASGNYLVTGDDNGNIAVWRFTADGSLDTSFGSSGETVVNLGYYEYGTQIALAADGQIVVTGFTNGPDGGLFALRLNDDGSLDTSFNSTGVRVIDLGPADGLAIQPWARSSSPAPGPMATSSASTPAMAAPILPLEPAAPASSPSPARSSRSARSAPAMAG